MNFDKLKEKCKGKTLLGVGPVSRNTIDVTIDLANRYDIPIMLIPSRRQIDWHGGYVGFKTKEFSKYVRNKDPKGNIILARDHGGPWQGNKLIGGESELDLEWSWAMDAATASYYEDILAKFDILHIDPSLKSRAMTEIEKDVDLLYKMCEGLCETEKHSVLYEAGTEEHGTGLTDIKQFEDFAKKMSKLDKVKFIVGNTGTYVRELSNTGNFDQKLVKDMLKICEDNGLWFKEHNLDYTDESILALHPQLGIHSANVAPEFATVETTAFMRALCKNGMEKECNDFIKIAYNSGKWKKWMISPSKWEVKPQQPLWVYCVNICGHYVFNYPEVLKIKEEAQKRFDLNKLLKDAIQNSIMKYLKAFGWVK